MKIILNGKPVPLPTKCIGSGGEADVYEIAGDRVVKIFKDVNHPDFQGNPQVAKAAQLRIAEHERKLRAFPSDLPSGVIVPETLAFNTQGKLVGYVMPYVRDAEVLLRYGKRPYREAHGVTDEGMVQMLQKLHLLVEGIHKKGAVIGDFNDLNVLIDPQNRPWMIDADSMQFGIFLSAVFTRKFVDPMLCSFGQEVMLTRPHTTTSDWYAFAIMLMQTLLFVGPYGGMYSPKDPTKRLKETECLAKRINLFHPEVRSPRPARHFQILPDDLLHHLERMFSDDVRGEFPKKLLELQFRTCSACGKVHARTTCPDCTPVLPAATKEIHTGGMIVTKVFETGGKILQATMQQGKLRYIFHENGAYFREDGRQILSGAKDSSLRFRIFGERTVVIREGLGIVLDSQNAEPKRFSVERYRNRLATLEATSELVVYAANGMLQKFGSLGPGYTRTIGQILPEQTRIWVNEAQGIAYYSAGQIQQAILFHPHEPALGKEVNLPNIPGRVIDMTAVFGSELIWLLFATDFGGKRSNHAYIITKDGNICAQISADEGDGWLGTIRGKCAVGRHIFSPTDDGITRSSLTLSGTVETNKVFPDTARVVDSESILLFGSDGIYVLSGHSRLWKIQMA